VSFLLPPPSPSRRGLTNNNRQPCNPTMPQARDAIIDADTALTGGVNKCALWKAFAKRGLGANAKRNSGTNRKEDYTIPAGVC